jgi:hypothetical protein
VPPLSSRPSSTANARDDPLRRGEQKRFWGRADLPGAGDRPSTYYAAVARTLSRRRRRDARLKEEIERVHADNFGVYGIEKVWRQLNRKDIEAGRERVARLMRELGLDRVVRGKTGARITSPRRPRREADRSGGPQVHGGGAESDLGRRPDLRPDPDRLRLCGLHHGPVQPLHRGLAGLELVAHGPRPGRRCYHAQL